MKKLKRTEHFINDKVKKMELKKSKKQKQQTEFAKKIINCKKKLVENRRKVYGGQKWGHNKPFNVLNISYPITQFTKLFSVVSFFLWEDFFTFREEVPRLARRGFDPPRRIHFYFSSGYHWVIYRFYYAWCNKIFFYFFMVSIFSNAFFLLNRVTSLYYCFSRVF